MEPRDYQIACLDAIRAGDNKRRLVVLPTASGKSFIFSMFIEANPDKKILLVVQKNILVEQAVKNIKIFTQEVGIYNAGLNLKEIKRVTVASIQSIISYKGELDFDYYLLDEIHRFAINNEHSLARKLLARMNDPVVIGFTATPFEGNALMYGPAKFFPSVTFQMIIRDMWERKFLVEVDYYAEREATKIDLKGVTVRGGDFVLSELNERIMAHKDKIQLQVEDALARSKGHKKIICLTTSIDHATEVYERLGSEACLIHSMMPKKHQDDAMDRFINGDTRIMVSVLICSEGLDIPKVTMLWMMRPTRSVTLFIQSTGRILRPYPGKERATMLDYGGIVEALGGITHAFLSVGQKKRKEETEICINCDAYFIKGSKKCPKCQTPVQVQCVYCLEMHPRGERCRCGHTIERDMRKSLTETAAAQGPKWVPVSGMDISFYMAKTGAKCLKIDYRNGPFGYPATEYLKIRTHYFWKFVHECLGGKFEEDLDWIDKNVKIPSAILTEKDGKYVRVSGRKF